jgi:threonine/homoserine/homoserine lactone efflux protein
MMLAYLLKGFTLGFSAAVSPGPFQVYLLSQTLKHGWRHTLPVVLAPLVTDGPIIILVLFVLAQVPIWFLNLLHIAGGCFILYLARGAYLAFRAADTVQDVISETSQQSFLKALLINWLNPGPYIFWSVVSGPILLQGWRQAASFGWGFVASFYVGFVGILIGFITLFATARRAGPQVRRVLNGVSALALLVFGLYQIWSGLAG